MEEARTELHAFEVTELWEHWLTAEQRRAVGRAAWSNVAMEDPRMEALAAVHARRQARMAILMGVMGLSMLLPAGMRMLGVTAASARWFDAVSVLFGGVTLAYGLVAFVLYRRGARRRSQSADWAAAAELAWIRRKERLGRGD
jgi:hypothetical protein